METSSVILIVGAGQLGSRYLQGLSKCTHPLRIYVVDTNLDTLLVAQQRWTEALTDNHTDRTVSYHARIDECPTEIDITIVATTAHKRVELVALIKKHAVVHYWVLEKVLVQSCEELDRLLAIMESASKVWVNTPRRMLAWHRLIRDSLVRRTPLQLKVTGKYWGLACNSVHFLDMLAWLSGESLTKILTNGLAKEWIEAKRPGNWEVMGVLTAQFSGGSTATLAVEAGESADLWYHLELLDGEFTWRIDEEKGAAVRSDGLSIPGRLPYQSEVTPFLVDQILSTGHCELPTLAVSAEIHRVFLDAMLDHWRKTIDATATSVPIT
jgi:predicted dehydrogenase